jgi:hypothetical protein
MKRINVNEARDKSDNTCDFPIGIIEIFYINTLVLKGLGEISFRYLVLTKKRSAI